jgi:hypothetical protein
VSDVTLEGGFYCSLHDILFALFGGLALHTVHSILRCKGHVHRQELELVHFLHDFYDKNKPVMYSFTSG